MTWICEACNEPLVLDGVVDGIERASCCGLAHERLPEDDLPLVLRPSLAAPLYEPHEEWANDMKGRG